MSCDSNDGELKLTEEYKYLLSCIRPLIDQLDKSRDAQLCLLWLSKLEQCENWERRYRNKILSELCKQVKSHCLKPPFNVSPPSGPLQNVILRLNDWKTRNWVIHELSEAEGSTEEVYSSSSQHSIQPIRDTFKPTVSPETWKLGHLRGNPKTKITKPSKVMDHSECFAIQKAYHERAQSDQMVIEKYQEIIKSLVSQQLKADISPSRLKKLQSTYELKMTELVHAFKKAQEENIALRRKAECFKGVTEKISVLAEENEYLRKQIFELEISKNTLEEKYKKSEEEKLAELSDLLEKLNESEKKLQDTDKKFTALEKKYEEKYHNFESEYQERINEKDMVHAAELSSLERLLEDKKEEINGLKQEIANLTAHFEQEMSLLKQQMASSSYFKKEDQMNSLKSRTKKLEKIREHMAVLFQSQLEQILAKKDFYISTLEMQLKMNSSECGGNAFSSDYNNILDQKVSALEAQYKKLIEESEKQYIKRRQIDLQKIHALEKQLLSFGGVAEDKESDVDHKGSSSRTASDTENGTKDSKAS